MRSKIKTEAFLANLPLFSGLGAAELARLAAGTSRLSLRRGEVLFRQGDPSTGLHAVVYGRIALAVRLARGKERVSAIIGAGRSFGEAILFLEKPYIVGAKALTDALVLHVAKEAVFGELERNPAFARRVIAALSAKLEATVAELDLLAQGSGSLRFASWLLLEAKPAEGAVTVALPASKRAIASKLNVSPEHLSRILRELTAEGLVQVSGRNLHIGDVARLRAWAGAGQ
jgi:CRP/FNR family transcriptional regulator, dissimilatory nitrate respiration regulator